MCCFSSPGEKEQKVNASYQSREKKKNNKKPKSKNKYSQRSEIIHDKTERIYFGHILHKTQTDPWLRKSKQKIPHKLAKREHSSTAPGAGAPLILPRQHLKDAPKTGQGFHLTWIR